VPQRHCRPWASRRHQESHSPGCPVIRWIKGKHHFFVGLHRILCRFLSKSGGWFGTWPRYFSIQLGMSSSQLTNSYFSEGGEKPPTRNNLGFCVGNSLIKPTKLSPKNVSACGGSDQQMGRVYQEEVGCKGLPTQNQYNWSFLPWISLEPQVAVIVHCSSSYIKPKPHKPATSRGEHLHMKCWIQVGFACITCRRLFPYVPWSKASAYTQSLGNGHQSGFRWIGIRFVRGISVLPGWPVNIETYGFVWK
jgi:hypothetical protein